MGVEDADWALRPEMACIKLVHRKAGRARFVARAGDRIHGGPRCR